MDIGDRVKATHPAATIELIHKAYVLTAKVHHGQVRKSGEAYLIHPLNVAFLLADWNLDEETVATGLLHDTVEDTVATLEEVRELFGDSVAHLVDGVTKIGRVTLSDAAAQKAESLRKMILAMGKDLRVILVKLADRLHNMRTLKHLPYDRQAVIARETVEISAPIAARPRPPPAAGCPGSAPSSRICASRSFIPNSTASSPAGRTSGGGTARRTSEASSPSSSRSAGRPGSSRRARAAPG